MYVHLLFVAFHFAYISLIIGFDYSKYTTTVYKRTNVECRLRIYSPCRILGAHMLPKGLRQHMSCLSPLGRMKSAPMQQSRVRVPLAPKHR